ncbi:hypothetical protein [Tardiphaga sp. 813_E8_N1_3]|uniref:hypothetical protein n=1 Tax=Tardiphaga sp. 813_E8_N1_3 TaxID=3240760 RepID=UPI003F1EBE53
MGILNDLIIGIVGGVLSADLVVYHKRWCRWIIGAAVRRIPDNATREIKHEEWLAALDETDGVIASFWHAAGCFVGAPKTIPKERRALVGKVRILIKASKWQDKSDIAEYFNSPIFTAIQKLSEQLGGKLAYGMVGSFVAWLFSAGASVFALYTWLRKLFF